MRIIAPFNNKVISEIKVNTSSDIERFLSIAYEAKKKPLSKVKRLDILRKVIPILKQSTLLNTAVLEGGKPLKDSIVEFDRCLDSFRICAEVITNEQGISPIMGINPASTDRIVFTDKQPIGVVVAISAFNHPMNLIAHQVGPAIAAGCPVIIKPASDTPLSCKIIVEALYEAGLPEEYCQLAIIEDNKIAEALATDKRVSFLSFIGSSKVGWDLRSKLKPGTRCALEHGGVAPAIINEDADIELAAKILTKGAFYHAGQVCVSSQNLFVQDSVFEYFSEAFRDSIKHLKTGDPENKETDIGPLIRERELQRVLNWVEESKKEGGLIIEGGHIIEKTCFEPTLISEPHPKSKVATNEIFGPVACLHKFVKTEEAIEKINNMPTAFQTSIFSTNIDTAFSLSSQIEASAILINDHTAFRVDWMPFAGLKESGLGIGGIKNSFEDMQTQKLTILKKRAV